MDKPASTDTACPAPVHPQLLEHWCRPHPPAGFPKLIAFKIPVQTPTGLGRKWFMEFYNPNTGVFASEVEVTYIDWPWRQGYLPTESDWDFIDVMH
ncbi:hypothetical protein ALQ64_03138 [Pseudomonas cannabina]|uniref:Uncharacterized protein n=1 Tax=Pseudomonas cannabina TaxID=86840 RepID=A0A3M3K1X2_PSECA|nr:hypothetical protein [Pseudomonas cannabina]RMN17109.1 hypothetical protein ALQ64_03138 [Pseudomonas cannabina]